MGGGSDRSERTDDSRKSLPVSETRSGGGGAGVGGGLENAGGLSDTVGANAGHTIGGPPPKTQSTAAPLADHHHPVAPIIESPPAPRTAPSYVPPASRATWAEVLPTLAPPEFDLRVHAHMREVNAELWDSIIDPDDLQVTHRFVRACQESRVENAEYRHAVVFRRGEVAAVASFCAFRVPLDVLATGLTRHLVNAIRRVRPDAFRVPVVFCGLPVSFGQSCLRFAPGLDDASRVAAIEALAGVAERFAAATGARIICFKEFDVTQGATVVPLVSLGFIRRPSLPSCRLALRWRTFAEYEWAMRANYRRQLRATRRVRELPDLTVRDVPFFSAHCERIFALYEQVADTAQYKLERLNLPFFERVAMLPEARAILVERGETLAAAAIVLTGPSTTSWILVGIDYAQLRELESYHLVLTEVVAHAIRRGSRELELGQTSYDAKTRLGALIDKRYLYLRWRSPIGHALFRIASKSLFPTVTARPRRVFRDGR
jgi:predicted N-acyltransferase